MLIGSYTVPGRCERGVRQGSTDAWLLFTPVLVRSWERRGSISLKLITAGPAAEPRGDSAAVRNNVPGVRPGPGDGDQAQHRGAPASSGQPFALGCGNIECGN